MRQILTPDDLKKGDLVPPGWYPAEIVDYTEDAAKTDQSTNCFFYFKILDGAYKGVTIKKLFNEKALGFGKNLWATLKFPFDPATGYDLNTDLFKQTVGQKLQIYSKRGTSNKGNDFNDVVDFRPLTAA